MFKKLTLIYALGLALQAQAAFIETSVFAVEPIENSTSHRIVPHSGFELTRVETAFHPVTNEHFLSFLTGKHLSIESDSPAVFQLGAGFIPTSQGILYLFSENIPYDPLLNVNNGAIHTSHPLGGVASSPASSNTVPEPSPLMLMLAGVLGLAGFALRRKN